jgi:hypothetical protein
MVQLCGGMILGATASVFGAPWAMGVMALLGAVASIAIGISVPAARRIR